MLIACSACRRQYDVGDFAPGSHVRCLCGALSEVPERAPRQAQVLHCSGCGGRLRSLEERCEYCGAEVAPAERAAGESCPECFARMQVDARYCSGCGLAIAPVRVRRAAADRRCPRCDEPLAVLDHPDGAFQECTRCAGLWLEREVFERFVESRRAEAVEPPPQTVRPRPLRGEVQDARRVDRRLPNSPPIRCPACGATMLYREYATGAELYLDACYDHGWWFDGGELSRLAEFVRGGGLRRAEQKAFAAELRRKSLARRAARLREERERAGLFGLLASLLADG